MSTSISCTIANQKVTIKENSVRTSSPSLQIELVKRLIECKSKVAPTESALPLFFNKYLRHYPISNVEFIENKMNNDFIQNENWGASNNVAA